MFYRVLDPLNLSGVNFCDVVGCHALVRVSQCLSLPPPPDLHLVGTFAGTSSSLV